MPQYRLIADEIRFKRWWTLPIVDKSKGFLYAKERVDGLVGKELKDATDRNDERLRLSKSFESKGHKGWDKSISKFDNLKDVFLNLGTLDDSDRGNADEDFEDLIQLLDVDMYVAVDALVLPDGYKIEDGKLRVVVDISKFKDDVNKLVLKISPTMISAKVVKQAAEQDFWALVLELLKEDEAYKLIGLLSARLLLIKVDKDMVDLALSNVKVLLNKSGKLSQGLVRLIGFVGLATVKGEPLLAHAVKFLKNPILGEDVDELKLIKLGTETDVVFVARKSKAEAGYVVYKKIMTEMKSYKANFEKLESGVKEKIRKEVLVWCIG